jgi:hypothetical protein
MKKSELRQLIREEISKVLNEAPNNEIVDILKELHSSLFSNQIRVRIENVNGYDNIVYDDPNMITKGILGKLRNSKFWNTGFDPTIGVFEGSRVNIVFQKHVQDNLNIANFDKQDWEPNY